MKQQAKRTDRVIIAGDIFSTPFENNCVAITDSDTEGKFLATDSEGVECWFHIDMVSSVVPGEPS